MADVSVRTAAPADAPAIATVQLRAWRAAYGDILPAGALDEVTEPMAAARWRAAIVEPPTRQHRVLVAVDTQRVVGLAALAPGDDSPGVGEITPAEGPGELLGELLILLVDEAFRGRGHGSRLLAAGIDRLRADGYGRAGSWVLDADVRSRTFLERAGWAPDGTGRTLDMGSPVREMWLHTDLRARAHVEC